MKEHIKETGRSYAVLFGIAGLIALVARFGLFIMDKTGVLTYDYISASAGSLLDQICTILMGSTLASFMFIAGLVMALYTATTLLYAYHFSKKNAAGYAHPVYALFWGLLTTVCALVIACIVGSGVLSAVQMLSMKSKLALDAGMMLMAFFFITTAITFSAALSLMLCAGIARVRVKKSLGAGMIIGALLSVLVVMGLTIASFAALNSVHLDGFVCAGWFALDTLVNGVLIFLAARMIKKDLLVR